MLLRLPPRKLLALMCACAALALCAAAFAAKPPIAGRDVLTGKRLALSIPRQAGLRERVGLVVPRLHDRGADARAFARAHKRQVAFLGINTEDSKQGARAFYKRFDLDYPSIWDPRGVLAGAWSRGAPTTLVFDRRHVLVQRIEGSASLAQLNAALKRVT